MADRSRPCTTTLKCGKVEAQGFPCYFKVWSCILSVCPASHIYMHYPMLEKNRLVELLYLTEVAITAYLFFAAHEYLHYREYGWRSSCSLRYHSYLIPSRCTFRLAVAFVQKANYSVFKKPATESEGIKAEQDLGEITETSGSSRNHEDNQLNKERA